MDKKEFQDSWKNDWQKQKSEGEGLAGLFQRFVRGADPAWIEHWEKIMYDAAGFAYETARELHSAENDKNKAKEVKSKLSKMTQNIYSSVVVSDDQASEAKTDEKISPESGE